MEKTRVILVPEAKEIYNYLKISHSKTENSIFRAIHQKVELIKANRNYGNNIPKRLIPNYYKKKYGITNLYRVELPNFWRMLYTLRKDKIEIIAFVIDIVDHDNYSKKFGYKKE
jgi:hypothetical protein